MLNFIRNLIQDQINENQGGGGPTETKPGAQAAPNPPTTEGEGDNLDELGYEKVASEKGDKDQKSKEDPKPTEEEIESATGYEEEPKVEDPKPEEKPQPASQTPDDKKDDLELKVDGLLDDEVKSIKEFAKAHKLTKEQAQALVESKKREIQKLEDFQKEEEKRIAIKRQETRKQWFNELKNDPDFGGEKFSHNVKRVEKMVNEFMPDFKKVLTESKTMLPPYVMKGLLNVANKLYSTTKLTQGDPMVDTETVDDKKEENNPLAYYN